MKLFYLWLIGKTILCGCGPEVRRYDITKVQSNYTIRNVGKFSMPISENSGLVRSPTTVSFWTHSDSGGDATLYNVDEKGKLIGEKRVIGLPNIDWEEIATAPDGRLFIGDIGNNGGWRNQFTIGIIAPNWEARDTLTVTSKITFSFEGLNNASTENERRTYDAEAFFYFKDHIYLISKNTSRGKRLTYLYKMPAKEGHYVLKPIDTIRIDDTITAADVSPDGSQFVLLSYGKMLFFEMDGGTPQFTRPVACMKRFKGQTEAIVFLNQHDILFTSEKGNVYKATFR